MAGLKKQQAFGYGQLETAQTKDNNHIKGFSEPFCRIYSPLFAVRDPQEAGVQKLSAGRGYRRVGLLTKIICISSFWVIVS